jgi:hypothetical protein
MENQNQAIENNNNGSSTAPTTTPENNGNKDSSEQNPGNNPSENGDKDNTGNPGAEENKQNSQDAEFILTDIDFQGLVPDDKQEETFTKYKSWFKGKDAANAYLKELKIADEAYKKQQSEALTKLKSDWEKELKSDEVFGKEYESNKNAVNEVLTKFGSEKDRAEIEKLGLTNVPAFNRIMFRFAKEIEEGNAMKATTGINTGVKRDAQGTAVMDFSKSLAK